MSMEDLFYGPSERTWIIPPRREFDSPPRRFYQPRPEIRPVERRGPPLDEIRPVERRGPPVEALRPVERLARVHTIPEPVPVNAGHEEIRKVVEVPVPSAVPPPVQVITNPAPAPPPPVQVVNAPPVQVVKRNISPPRAIFHHPIELKVPMCCEKCAKKVKERLLQLEGVENVVTDQYNQKVTVHGRVDPSRVLQRVKLVKKRSVFWDMTVDYSENYRRARQAEDTAIAREQSKAAAVKAEQVAVAKAMAAPRVAPMAAVAPEVVVKLPQARNEPKVTAILPPEQQTMGPKVVPMPYAVDSRVHDQRYVSPPRGFRQEFFHGPPRDDVMRRPESYNRPVY